MNENERVKSLRKILGLNQTDFAKRIGLKGNSLSDIERGKNSLSEQNLLSICREFSVNDSWLRFGEGEMFNQSKAFNLNAFMEERGATELEIELIKTYFEMPAKLRQSIVEHFHRHFSSRAEQQHSRLTYSSVEHEMTLAEIHAKIDRDWKLEREAEEESEVFGSGSSGTATA